MTHPIDNGQPELRAERNVGVDEAEDREIDRLWVEEAERRYQDYLDGKVEAIPGEEVIRRIRAARR